MHPLYPFRAGDRIRVSVRSWSVTKNVLFVRVRYNDGTPDRRQMTITHSAGDYSNELFYSEDPFLEDGYIKSLTVDSGLEDREAYIAVFVDNEAELLHYCVFAGLLDVVHTPLGFFEHEDFSHTWVYQAQITNGANAGDHEYEVVPGAGKEFEIVGGYLWNLDATGHVGFVNIRDDDDNELIALMEDLAGLTFDGSTAMGYPTSDVVAAGGSQGAVDSRRIVSGGMKLYAKLASVEANDLSRFSLVARIRGGKPAVTLASPALATETVNKDEVFQ